MDLDLDFYVKLASDEAKRVKKLIPLLEIEFTSGELRQRFRRGMVFGDLSRYARLKVVVERDDEKLFCSNREDVVTLVTSGLEAPFAFGGQVVFEQTEIRASPILFWLSLLNPEMRIPDGLLREGAICEWMRSQGISDIGFFERFPEVCFEFPGKMDRCVRICVAVLDSWERGRESKVVYVKDDTRYRPNIVWEISAVDALNSFNVLMSVMNGAEQPWVDWTKIGRVSITPVCGEGVVAEEVKQAVRLCEPVYCVLTNIPTARFQSLMNQKLKNTVVEHDVALKMMGRHRWNIGKGVKNGGIDQFIEDLSDLALVSKTERGIVIQSGRFHSKRQRE